MKEFRLQIKEVIQRTDNVKSFRLDINKDDIDFNAGQFLCVWLEDSQEYKRYISISSSPTEKCYIEFTKKITTSNFSKFLNSLKPGDYLKIQYPFGKFNLDEKNDRKIAFISGGIGITPIRSICKYVVDNNLAIDMILLYANRSIRDIVFHDDFDYMQKKFPNLKVSHVLCEPAEGFKCSVGLINSQVIKNEIPDYNSRKFYVCGPPSMVIAMKKILTDELMLSIDKIITENFTGY